MFGTALLIVTVRLLSDRRATRWPMKATTILAAGAGPSAASRELRERAWVPGLVKTDLARAGDPELRDPAPALILDRRDEVDPLALELLDGPLDVMAHEEQGVMSGPAAPAGAGVDGDLARRQGEDQPAVAGIDPLEAQHVAKELASSLGVLGEDIVCAPAITPADRSPATTRPR